MSDQLFNPDDPRLTAYALGEMDEEKRTALEQRVGRLAGGAG